MYLIIDVGNTRVKLAVFHNGRLLENCICAKGEILVNVLTILEDKIIERAILSSVGGIDELVVKEIANRVTLLQLNSTTKVPFDNKYGTPKTLGVDRIALVSGAVSYYSSQNVLVIDAGTCITYDFVTKDAAYLGGAISPGLLLRYKSLNDYTAKLPLLKPEDLDSFIGCDTNTSIHSGVINGIVNEIDGVILQYQKKFKDLTIVLTGGDTFFLSKQLKSGIFANENFLLESLYSILIYNI